jgi:FkbM family methyltransferase
LSGPSTHQASASNLSLIHTEAGFDLLIDPADYISVLVARDGLFEIAETELVTRILRPKDTCIDVGSQVGYYSCLFAKLVGEKGRVYAFDANPQACQSTRRNLALNGAYSSEAIHAALADHGGTVPFHISSSDQTGLCSLGPIPTCTDTISVPCLRLETFLEERRINSVRLLKIDVEGAEEMVLRGLGHLLGDHIIDYILLECFDERLRLLNTSTEAVAAILKSAGYTSWEYGMQNGCGWSQAAEVRSRGDCNYLFTSPEVGNNVPNYSLAPAVDALIQAKNQLIAETNELRRESANLRENQDRLRSDIEWFLGAIKAHEEESARLAAVNRNSETVLRQIQSSASWRMLTKWRKFRNWVAPENTWYRRLYDSMLRGMRGGGPVAQK